MEFIFTRVLVIGGGIAGMRAALAAKERGADVILLSKKKTGKAGSSLITDTNHRIYSINQPEGYDMIEETLKNGLGLCDEELVKVLARDSKEVVSELINWGCPLEFEYYNGNEEIPLFAHCKEKKGIQLTRVLSQLLKDKGVKIFDQFTVIKLVTHNERVQGAFAVWEGKVYCFLAGAVVLATGGLGQIYYPNDNPSDLSGDGIALAWDCGAELIDLEFVQFYPYYLREPVFMKLDKTIFELGAKLINQYGDYFMSPYSCKEPVREDNLIREMFLHGGEITLDLMDVELFQIEKVSSKLLSIYLADEEMVVSPVYHFFMGGIRIDKNASSTVRGLYACGEVCGGIHGANKLKGNALTECLVFGRLAGQNAANEALEQKVGYGVAELEFFKTQLKIPEAGNDQYLLIKTGLGHLMWEGAGVVRDSERLITALHQVRNEMNLLKKSHPRSLKEWYEVKNKLLTAKLIIESALYRQESRGAHYRMDYPESDPEWEGNIIVKRNQRFFQKKKKKAVS